MPSVYSPRRPLASSLWQVVHHCWSDFVAGYEHRHRSVHGPLRHDSIEVVGQFHRCGDLAAGFTRLQCPGCGHERLVAFTCRTKVVYRSKRSWHTKRNFQVFDAVDFLAAAVEHIPPKGQQCHAARAA